MDAADRIAEIVAEHDLRPVAVLLTHGHFDHAASASLVADRYGAGCWVAAPDEHQLLDPLSGLPEEMHPLVADLLGPASSTSAAHRRDLPVRMLELSAGPVRLAGLDFDLLPAPGHTPGSTMICLDYTQDVSADDETSGSLQVVFTGDVVFAGSIGRTDLPGGDGEAMHRTLTEVVLTLPDEAILLPGHGPQTSLGAERTSNPFLVPITRSGSVETDRDGRT